MTENAPDVVSTTDAPAALKSLDTAVVNKAEPQTPNTAPAVEPAPEGDSDDAPAADASNGERKEQRLPRWMKERLERERLVTAARTREQVLRELQATPPATQEAPADPGRPLTLADFDYDTSAFQKHLTKVAVEEFKREQQAQSEAEKQQQQAESFKAKVDAFETRIGAGAWEDIEASPLNTDPAFKPLVDLFLGDEHDLDIAHHLARHPAEAQRLLGLAPLQRVREVAKLADSFATPPAPAPVVKKTTNAPPPPKTVTGGAKPTPSPDDDSLTPAQRIAIWQQQRRR